MRVVAGLLLAGLLLAAGCAGPPTPSRADPAEAVPPSPASDAADPSPSDPAAAAGAPPASVPSARLRLLPTPAHHQPGPGLRARLEAALAAPDVQFAAPFGVAVVDARGETVFERNAGAPLVPASVAKLASAAGALAVLGPDHRFVTRARATAPVGPDGIVHGDLVLVGGADPALATPAFAQAIYPGRPRTPLEGLADVVVAAGVRRVTGAVLGDPTVLADQPVAAGWLPRYLSDGDAGPVSGLTIDMGRKLFLRNGRLVSGPSPDPAAEAAAALYLLLRERGVLIDGGPAATRQPPPATVALAEVASPPLRDLLRHTVQRSDNHLADGIFRAVGAAMGDPTWAGAEAATRQALEPLQLDWTGVRLADGSGLSRDDAMPTAFLARLQARMSASSLAGEWQPLMAVSGQSGTLRRRLRGTVAEHRLRGKTGSLQGVRSIAGSVVGPDGELVHLAVVANGLPDSALPAARRLADRVVLAVAEELYGCVWLAPAPPPPAPPAPPGAPPPPPPAPPPPPQLLCAR